MTLSRILLFAVLVGLVGCGGAKIDLGSNEAGAGAGSGAGPTVIASEIQLIPTKLVSDGTTLFWAADDSSSLWSMPVTGGTIQTIASSSVEGLLGVDDFSVYVLAEFGSSLGVYTVPKSGGSLAVVTGAEDNLNSATIMGANLYWLEVPNAAHFVAKSSPLLGGSASTIATFEVAATTGGVGVTSSTIFFGGLEGLDDVPIGSDGGSPKTLTGTSECQGLVSDTDAVYCDPSQGSVMRIASDGTITPLGTAVNETGMGLAGPVAIDDVYAYWVDEATVGTIMKAVKAGGSAAIIIAHDASPVAIAVDDNAVYWSDLGGNIMRLPK